MEWVTGIIIFLIIGAILGNSKKGGVKRDFECDKCGSKYWHTHSISDGGYREKEHIECAKCGYRTTNDRFLSWQLQKIFTIKS